jgi:hypothetical protein
MRGERAGLRPQESEAHPPDADPMRENIAALRRLEAEATRKPDDAALERRVGALRAEVAEQLAAPLKPSDPDPAGRRRKGAQFSDTVQHHRAMIREIPSDTGSSNPDAVLDEAAVRADEEHQEQEETKSHLRLALRNVEQAYNEVVETVEQSVDGPTYAERANAIIREAHGEVAEIFGTRPLSDLEADDFVEQSEHLLESFSGLTEDFEEAKRILDDKISELNELKVEVERNA